MMLTRRTFLSAAIAAIPGCRLAAALLPIKDADFFVNFDYPTTNPYPQMHFTTYYSGKVECRVFGELLTAKEDGAWTRLGGMVNNWWVETRAKRDGNRMLSIDWFNMATNKDGSPFKMTEDFRLPFSVGGALAEAFTVDSYRFGV